MQAQMITAVLSMLRNFRTIQYRENPTKLLTYNVHMTGVYNSHVKSGLWTTES